MPGLVRHASRLREIAIAKMVEGNAIERANRALRSKTQAPFELSSLKVGDLVDFYRHPNKKDITGWLGPAVVCNMLDAKHGNADVKWQGKVFTCKHQHLRRHLVLLTMLYAFYYNVHNRALQMIMEFLTTIESGSTMTFGETREKGVWKLTRTSRKDPKMHQAIVQCAKEVFQLKDVKTVLLFKGTPVLHPRDHYDWSHVFYWPDSIAEEPLEYEGSPKHACSTKSLLIEAGSRDDWRKIKGIQFLMKRDEDPMTVISVETTESKCRHHKQKDHDHDEDDEEKPPELIQESDSEDESVPPGPSPTTESTSQADSFETAHSELYFVHEKMNPELLEACRIATQACMQDADEFVGKHEHRFDDAMNGTHSSEFEEINSVGNFEVIPDYHYFAANARANLPRDTAIPQTAEFIDIEYPEKMSCFLNTERFVRTKSRYCAFT